MAAARAQRTAAAALWHKKSGAGYTLFVEYYSTQPMGVVVAATATAETTASINEGGGETLENELLSVGKRQHEGALDMRNDISISVTRNGGGGMSRASKRRRKKKLGQEYFDATADPESETATVKILDEKEKAFQTGNINNAVRESPLLQAVQAYQSSSYSNPGKRQQQNHKEQQKQQKLNEFFQALSRPLPLTFRLRRLTEGSLLQQPQHSESSLRDQIETQFSQWVTPQQFDPNHIYQARTSHNCKNKNDTLVHHSSNTVLTKATLSRLAPELHEFLQRHAANGTLARQELGSMLPVLAVERAGCVPTLKAKAKRLRILDLCASPGSKTLQALELVMSTTMGQGGRVCANDVHPSRLEALKEAVARSGVKFDPAILSFSCLDARQYPIPSSSSKLFHIVLCDVPCSGDGTIRKDPHILKHWTPDTANALHAVQLLILSRALDCVAIGGVVSYSTCSFNPVEDEAVVAAVMQSKNDKQKKKQVRDKEDMPTGSEAPCPAFELVPWPKMDGLIHRPGVSDWKVADYVDDTKSEDECFLHPQPADKDGNKHNDEEQPRLRWHKTYHEAVEAKMLHSTPSMWPPTSHLTSASDPLHLERCFRLLPQDHDSGGFFVALIRRNF